MGHILYKDKFQNYIRNLNYTKNSNKDEKGNLFLP